MSTVNIPPRKLTPEDVLQMPDGKYCELVDGRLVERETSFKTSYVRVQLSSALANYCEPIGLAYVFMRGGYTCFPGKPNRMRRPDISAIRVDRLPFDQIDDGFLTMRPDVAVEIIAPKDRVIDLEDKLDDYRDAGIPLVWLVYPPTRKVRILRPEGPPTELGPDDELTGEDVLHGFRCRVADLFAGSPQVALNPNQ
jgi:Uma2 family endonuclease